MAGAEEEGLGTRGSLKERNREGLGPNNLLFRVEKADSRADLLSPPLRTEAEGLGGRRFPFENQESPLFHLFPKPLDRRGRVSGTKDPQESAIGGSQTGGFQSPHPPLPFQLLVEGREGKGAGG